MGQVCARENARRRGTKHAGCVRTTVTARYTDFEYVALLRCDGLGKKELVGDRLSLPRVTLGGQAVLVRHALARVVEGAPCRGDADEGFEGSRDLITPGWGGSGSGASERTRLRPSTSRMCT
jgi:hypothetical protein